MRRTKRGQTGGTQNIEAAVYSVDGIRYSQPSREFEKRPCSECMKLLLRLNMNARINNDKILYDSIEMRKISPFAVDDESKSLLM